MSGQICINYLVKEKHVTYFSPCNCLPTHSRNMSVIICVLLWDLLLICRQNDTPHVKQTIYVYCVALTIIYLYFTPSMHNSNHNY